MISDQQLRTPGCRYCSLNMGLGGSECKKKVENKRFYLSPS